MKTIATIAILAMQGIANAGDDISDMQALTEVLTVLEGRQQPAVQGTAYNPQLEAIMIRTAYPNNPQMWRYLERNPHAAYRYLGR